MNVKPFFTQLHARAERILGHGVNYGDAVTVNDNGILITGTFIRFQPIAIDGITIVLTDGNREYGFSLASVKYKMIVRPQNRMYYTNQEHL